LDLLYNKCYNAIPKIEIIELAPIRKTKKKHQSDKIMTYYVKEEYLSLNLVPDPRLWYDHAFTHDDDFYL